MSAEAEPDSGAWQLRGGLLSLELPRVMGILNVTPDSFSDGGLHADPARALERAEAMVDQGADLIDVGAESTRPGAAPVDEAEELCRLLPVLRLLKARLRVPVSADTRRSVVAREALEEGVEIVNDVSGLADPQMGETIAAYGAGAILMHMRGTPETMQHEARYRDVAAEVAAELAPALARAREAGIADASIVLDPGIGFAKDTAQNVEMIARLGVLRALGRPLLLGASRKSFIGRLSGGAPAGARAGGTVAACIVGLLQGARIFRVHDVALVRQALDVAEALRRAAPAAS